ncbi:hypothetical protein LQ948_04775 [Jiella sp. MQZ9-1]|uniref:Uncharacterized protein n=1 Tax=Jiella flava TaxID=2816857 RepID=A0A939JVN3_9HYPH|nr:phage tail tube protein [Jiella flava]MBO0662152.1 hypothetical protein [Jiella flava]MCD2470519.1 hypothetical protein [Jiella flava]
MKRHYRKLAVLSKIESTYGQDASPTGKANAMLMSDVQFTPMQGEEVSRDLLLPYLGHQGVELAGVYAKLTGSIEIAGVGTAGKAPAYGPLPRACGLAETLTADTSAAYAPVSSNFEAATTYFNADGVNHVLLGVRGSFKADLAPKKIPKFHFDLMGLYGTVSDTALPTVDQSAFIRPLIVDTANTTVSLHGWSAIAESLEIDLGNKVEARFLIGEESMQITERNAVGTAVVEAQPLSVINWFDIAEKRTRGALSVVHGTTAGNIVEFAAKQVEIGRPTQGKTQDILNYSLPLMLCANAGNDDLTITVR